MPFWHSQKISEAPFTLGTVTLFIYLYGTHARAYGAMVPGGAAGRSTHTIGE